MGEVKYSSAHGNDICIRKRVIPKMGKALSVAFRLLVPGITILLLIVGPIYDHKQAFQPAYFDWAIRILLSIFFYWMIRLVRENKGAFWNSAKAGLKPFEYDEGLEKVFFFWNAFGYSIVMIVITYLALSTFTLISGVIRFAVAGINGLTFFTYMVSGYRSNP